MPLYNPATSSAVTSANITDGTIVDADVNASAAIAYSKLNLAASVKTSDLASDVGPMPLSLLAPFDPRLAVSFLAPGSNAMLGVRVTALKTGTLHDLTVGITTSSGNLRVAVYDTGDTTTTVRTRLYDSGSVASPGTGWQIIADPALAVTAGKQYDLAVIGDNGTVALVRGGVLPTAAFATLPTNFWTVPGAATPRTNWLISPGSFTCPTTIADGSLSTTQTPVYIMGRIT